MSVISLDEVWFRRNPDRQLRLRRQTAEERSASGIAIRLDMTAWCIVERDTGAVTPFGLKEGEAWDDDWDGALERLLQVIRTEAA